jgi:hypothetical protein
VLALELGLRARPAGELANLRGGAGATLATALALPVGLILLAFAGHREDPFYEAFLGMFTARLGGDPLYLTLFVAAAFYLYAALRRVPFATEGLTVVLAAFAFVGPQTLTAAEPITLRAGFLLAAGTLQIALGVWRRESWRWLVGIASVVIVATIALPLSPEAEPLRGVVACHLVLLAALIVAAVFDDPLAQLLRAVVVTVLVLTCVAVIFADPEQIPVVPEWTLTVYPLGMIVLLAVYAVLLGHWPSLGAAASIVLCWVVAAAARGYAALRHVVVGLDYLALSLALFALAVLISLGKSGLLPRWMWPRQESVTDQTG